MNTEQGPTVYESSVLQPSHEPIRDGQFAMPTWSLIVVLVIIFVILKSFIYIKDGQRDGK